MNANQLLWSVTGGLVLLPLAGTGQEALRSAVQADRTLAYRPPAPSRAEQVPHLGPVQLSLGASLSGTYDDNVERSGGDQVGDFIVRPQVDIGALYAITEASALTMGFGVGYEWYLDISKYSGLTLAPESALNYTVRIKDLALSVYDQASYTKETESLAETANLARYPRLENTAGIRAVYTMDHWQGTAGYSHYNFWAYDDDYDYLNRAAEQFILRGGYLLAEQSQVGLEGTAAFTAYDTPSNPSQARDDFDSYSFGPYAELQITESLRATVRAGYSIYQFADNTIGSGLAAVESTQDGYYAQLELRHQLTEFISHTLSAVHDMSVGVQAEFTTRSTLSYGIQWQTTDNLNIGGGVTYVMGEESDSRPGSLLNAEEYDRFGFNISAGYRVTERIRTSLSYRFYDRNSNLDGQDYINNVVTLLVGYRY